MTGNSHDFVETRAPERCMTSKVIAAPTPTHWKTPIILDPVFKEKQRKGKKPETQNNSDQKN